MSIAEKIDSAIRAACPIDGVSIGNPNDKTTWRIDFADSATAEQRAAAQSVIASFVVPVESPNDAINAQIDAQITALEQGQLLPRGTREFTLYCMVRDAQRDLGLTEPQLYAAQVGYRRLKDFDAQIKALRAQRKP